MAKNKKISEKIYCATIDNPKTPYELKWINIFDAGKKEIEYLRKEFNFDISHLHSSLAKTIAQRPMISKSRDYVFMVLHFPMFIGDNATTAEVDFFIGPKLLITINNNSLPSLNDFFNLFKKDGDSFLAFEYESSMILLYEVLEKLINSCYGLLDRTSVDIETVEDIIFAGDQKKAVSKILSLRRNNINMRRILRTHKSVMKKLIRLDHDIQDPKLENNIEPHPQIAKYYNRLIDHSKTIWEILENQKEMIDVLNNTNESMQNDQISNIMKILTIFSVIVLPLTFLAGIFGMNVDNMPIVNSPHGFWIIISIMFLGGSILLFIFEKKKWL